MYNNMTSPLHLMCAIAHAHTSTCATSLMHVKIAHATSLFDTYCLGHWNEENKRKTKASTLTVDHFSLTFVNLG